MDTVRTKTIQYGLAMSCSPKFLILLLRKNDNSGMAAQHDKLTACVG